MTAASDGNNAVTWNWIEHEKLTLRLNTVGFAARNPGSIRWKLQFQLLETISFLPMKPKFLTDETLVSSKGN